MSLRSIILFLLCATAASSVAKPPTISPPAGRLALSKFADRILLVEVTAVRREILVASNGLELRQLVVSGKVLEVVRGPKPNGFEETVTDVMIVDGKALAKGPFRGLDAIDGFVESEETGAAGCRSGGRYVVLYALGRVCFHWVGKNDASWRRGIVKNGQLPLTTRVPASPPAK